MHRVDKHSLHSPFLFTLNDKVFKNPSLHRDEELETLRSKLLSNQTQLETTTFGATSRTKTLTRTVGNIAEVGISRPKYSWLLSGICKMLDPNITIELGASIGLNTLYLARSSKKVLSFEGCTNTLNFAADLVANRGVTNIDFVEGNIDHTLTNRLGSINQVDFAFIDANHRYKPTLNYFNSLAAKAHTETVIVFDDIHWSREMTLAWEDIRKDSRISLSLDLFQIGIVFFDPNLTKQHHHLTF